MRGFFGRVIAFYERWVRRALSHPFRLAGVCAILIVASYLCYHALGSDVLPKMDKGGFVLDYIAPAGSSLQGWLLSMSCVKPCKRSCPQWFTTGTGIANWWSE